ncbi:MAG: hypothetical protein AAFU34_20395 [Pseudomonadota bacterium]
MIRSSGLASGTTPQAAGGNRPCMRHDDWGWILKMRMWIAERADANRGDRVEELDCRAFVHFVFGWPGIGIDEPYRARSDPQSPGHDDRSGLQTTRTGV